MWQTQQGQIFSLSYLGMNGACGQTARQAGTLIYSGNVDILGTKYRKRVICRTEDTWMSPWLSPPRAKDSDTCLAHSPNHLSASLLVAFFSSFFCIRVCSWPLPLSLGDYSCSYIFKESLSPDAPHPVSALPWGAVGLYVQRPTGRCQLGDQQNPWKSLALPCSVPNLFLLINPQKFRVPKQKLLQSDSHDAFLVSKSTEFQQREGSQKVTTLHRHTSPPWAGWVDGCGEVWAGCVGSSSQETEVAPWKLERLVKQSTASSKSFPYLCSV